MEAVFTMSIFFPLYSEKLFFFTAERGKAERVNIVFRRRSGHFRAGFAVYVSLYRIGPVLPAGCEAKCDS